MSAAHIFACNITLCVLARALSYTNGSHAKISRSAPGLHHDSRRILAQIIGVWVFFFSPQKQLISLGLQQLPFQQKSGLAAIAALIAMSDIS